MITIMTPVYNRAYIIENLYKSLISQTVKDFEWIIIDDGSTDNLKSLVNKWEHESTKFPIKYVYRENGGKHRAWNTGLKYIDGDWTFVVDSDDYLTNDAIEKAYKWIDDVKGIDFIGGVSGCRGKSNKIRIGFYPQKERYIDASNLERYRYHLQGDKAEIYRTELLRRFPFPEFKGEKFIAENAVFGRIARAGYIVRWYPDITYICEYREDGLTNNVAMKAETFFQGYTYMIKESDKYCSFPVNYVSIGRYADIAKRKGLSGVDARELIEVNLFDYYLGILINNIVKLRRKCISFFNRLEIVDNG